MLHSSFPSPWNNESAMLRTFPLTWTSKGLLFPGNLWKTREVSHEGLLRWSPELDVGAIHFTPIIGMHSVKNKSGWLSWWAVMRYRLWKVSHLKHSEKCEPAALCFSAHLLPGFVSCSIKDAPRIQPENPGMRVGVILAVSCYLSGIILSGVIYQFYVIYQELSVRSYPSVTYQELFLQFYVISQLSISSVLSLRSYLSVLISSRSSALHPVCSSLCSSSEAKGVQKNLGTFQWLSIPHADFIAEAQQRFWGSSLDCNCIKHETDRCADKIQWVIELNNWDFLQWEDGSQRKTGGCSSHASYFIPESVLHLIPSEPMLRLLLVWHQYFLDLSAVSILTLLLQANKKIDAF